MYFALSCATCEAEYTYFLCTSSNQKLSVIITQRKLNSYFLNIHSTVTDKLNVERFVDVWIDGVAVCVNDLCNCLFSTLHDSS